MHINTSQTSHRLYLKDGWWSFRSCILLAYRSRVWAFPPSPPSWLCKLKKKKKKDVMSKDRSGCETTYSLAGELLVNHKSLAVGCVLSCDRGSFIFKHSMINIYKIDLFIYLMWPTTCDQAHKFFARCLKVNTENQKPQLSTAAFRWSSGLRFLHTGFIFWPGVYVSPLYTICGQWELARRELGS